MDAGTAGMSHPECADRMLEAELEAIGLSPELGAGAGARKAAAGDGAAAEPAPMPTCL